MSTDANGAVIECVDPVDCAGSWGEWGACDATCGSGTRTRTYTVSQQSAVGGLACPATNGDSEDETCDAGVDCASCGVGDEPSLDGTSCVACPDGSYSGYGDSCSVCDLPRIVSDNRGQCIDAPAPAPASEERVVTGEVSIDASMEEVEADRAVFEADFQAAMVTQFASSGISISAADVTIESITAGSVVVAYSIRVTCLPSECDGAVAANNAAVAAAASGDLAVGSFPSVTPAPTPPVLPPAPPPPDPPPPPPPPSQSVVAPSPTTATSAGSTVTATVFLVVAAVALW